MTPAKFTSEQLRLAYEEISKETDGMYILISRETADMILNAPAPRPLPKRTWKLDEKGNVLITARIKNVSTGEIKEKPHYLLFPDWDNENPSWYIWEEGNFSCDCNRAIFFDDEDEKCGETRYRVQLINNDDGGVFYSEFE